MKMSLIALLWAATVQMAAFLCSFCGSLEASAAVYQLSASCWLTLLSCVHTPRTQRQRLALSVTSPPQTGKDRPVFFPFLCGPPTLPPSSTPDTDNKISASSNLISPHLHPSHHLSLRPRYAAGQEIKAAGDLQEGLSVSRHL